MNYRQKTVDLLLQVLGDPATGFNVQHASLAVTYDVPACAINWTLPSENLILGAFDPELLELARITAWPALVIATEEATLTNDKKFASFSGDVIVNLDAYIRFREVDNPDGGIPAVDISNNYEKRTNAFEDAVYRALRAGRSAFGSNDCNWVQFQSNRSSVGVLADGYTQRATMICGFRIVIN